MNVLIIQNCAIEGPGRYRTYLRQNRVAHDVFPAWQGGSYPPVSRYDAFIICGTPVSVNDIHRHPYLLRERCYLDALIERNKPVLGICFGGQLLGNALGAAVVDNHVMEIGVYQVAMTGAERGNSVFDGFPSDFPVFHWHGDTFDVPPGARLLATGNDCRNQAFAYGNAIALQFHLEVTPQAAGRWATAYQDELAQAGKTGAQIIEACRAVEEEMGRLAWRLMDGFVRVAANSHRQCDQMLVECSL